MNNKQTNKCTECKGSKKMYVNQFYEEENTIPCIYCKGTGKQEQTMEERFEELWSNNCIEGNKHNPTDTMYYEGFMSAIYKYAMYVRDEELALVVQQERERSTRKTIKDIAPNGVTGGMIAITKKSVNGKNTFPVVSVHFEHDLIALDDFDDENNPTWYRAEDIIKAINQDHE